MPAAALVLDVAPTGQAVITAMGGGALMGCHTGTIGLLTAPVSNCFLVTSACCIGTPIVMLPPRTTLEATVVPPGGSVPSRRSMPGEHSRGGPPAPCCSGGATPVSVASRTGGANITGVACPVGGTTVACTREHPFQTTSLEVRTRGEQAAGLWDLLAKT